MSVQKIPFPLPREFEALRPTFDALFFEVLRRIDVRNSAPANQPGLVYINADGVVQRVTLGAGLSITDGVISSP
jgi:hypothetical protein